METQKKLLKNYFKFTSKPGFNNFVQKKQDAIENISVHIEEETALELQRNWVRVYNNTIQIERPDKRLQERPIRVSEKFKMIFEISKAKRKARHQFRLASINVTSDVLKVSADNQEEEEEEEQEEKAEKESNDDEVDEEEEEQEEKAEKDSNDDEVDEEEEQEDTLDFIMKQKIANSDVEEELKKLINSSCVNLLNIEYQRMYSKIIPKHMYRSILQECNKKKEEFNKSLNEDTANMINILFDELKKFQFDDNTQGIIKYIDEAKAKIEDKLSDQYNLLCIVNAMVTGFSLYKKEDKLSESTHLRKFEQLLDHFFIKTQLVFKDGESVSQSTKRMKIMSEDEISYGRRIDLLVASEQDEDCDDIELCSVEFKKTNGCTTKLTHQQCKNIRINACILNDIHLILRDDKPCISYLDFVGRRAYISQLFKFQGCYIALKVAKFCIPKSLVELDQSRKSIINLYSWRQCLINNSNLVSLARITQYNEFALVDLSVDTEADSIQSPPREMQPMKIFLSPSKGSKRTRSIFEQED